MWKTIIFGVVGFMALPAFAQVAKLPWEEYDKHITSRADVAALSNDLFNEQVDLYNGRLSFRHVDIDIPGNSGLPVTLARKFSVQERYDLDLLLVDWDLDLPQLSGVFAQTYYELNFSTSHKWPDQRCSGPRSPPVIELAYAPSDYWYGIHADIPGGGEVVEPAPGVRSPSAGGPYRWVTAGLTWFSCLPSIKNGTGEGFLAITADGTKYWFDWMAMYDESMLERCDSPTCSSLTRKRNVLYATRVEDRLGNWVTYAFSNAATSPARLDKIESNDGRQIDIAYDAQGRIASASDGTRTWFYRYAIPNADNDYAYGLTSVTLPDESKWLIDFNDLAKVSTLTGAEATCDLPGWGFFGPVENKTGTITHPSGAIGEFEVGQRLHGRSNVPQRCQGSLPDTYSDYVRMYWTHSLLRKRISGAGLPIMQWDYRYNDSHQYGDRENSPNYVPPGSWAPGPYTYVRITDGANLYIIADPVCVTDDCAGKVTTEVTGPGGEWTRYTFGNSYRYNEHKLLKTERGTGPASISRVEQFTYELARSGQAFPTPVGVSLQYKGDAITETHLRPSRIKTIIQDGVIFKSVVNNFDEFGRPLSITKSSSPVP